MIGILLLFSCSSLNDMFLKEVPDPVLEEEAEFKGPPQMHCDSTHLSFGELSVLDAQSETLALTCENHGAQDLILNNVVNATADFVLAVSTDTVSAGEAVVVDVTFTPTTSGGYSDELRLFTNAPESAELVVPLSGSGLAPVAGFYEEGVAFGAVSVGCEAVEVITIENNGSMSLTVTDLDLPEPFAFVRDISLPWTIAAGQAREVELQYTPDSEQSHSVTLTMTSDDPLNPTRLAAVTGSGVGDGWQTDVFVQSEGSTVDTIIAVSTATSMGDDIDRFLAAFPTYIETLADYGADYRVAIVMEDGGEVVGDIDYISEESGAGEVAESMMSGVHGDDAEASLQMLLDALSLNSGWTRAGRLNLVGISDASDQSPDDYESYLDAYSSFRKATAVTVVHGIGGDYPAGCSHPWDAEPYTNVYQATVATGGSFQSLCTTNWDGLMEDLALASLATPTTFELSLSPDPDSIRVSVDGAAVEQGVSYDADSRSVVFDTAPAPGAQIEIDYLSDGSCL